MRKSLIISPNLDFEAMQDCERTQPERRLLAAMLAKAILDYTSSSYVGVADRHNAGRWLFKNSEARFTFRYCCAQLDLEPEEIRRSIRHLEIVGIPWVARRY